MGPQSGAIMTSVSKSTSSLTSIWEAEILACSEGAKAALFVNNTMEAMEIPIPTCRKVFGDNEGQVEWVNAKGTKEKQTCVSPLLGNQASPCGWRYCDDTCLLGE